MHFDNLSEILRAYDAAFDTTALQAAWLREKSPLAEWANIHLTPDTLLTSDELLQFSVLQKTGAADRLSASTENANVLNFENQEMKEAIQELQRSTTEIEKQMDTLKQHQDALSRLVRDCSQEAGSRTALESKQAQAWALERKAAKSSLEELAECIELRISELEQNSSSHLERIRHAINGTLQSDDKLLASLQKLACELDVTNPEEQEDVVRLREICARLIKNTVETIRTKLDRLYLESVEKLNNSTTNGTMVDEDSAAVQEELESLYAEILPVAQMSVEQQFLGPALKSISAKNCKSLTHSTHAADYIYNCLEHLLEQITKLTARVEASHAHISALDVVIGAANMELAVQVTPPPKKERRPTISSPGATRHKSPGSSISPVRRRGASRTRRRSSGASTNNEESPLDQLLRSLGLGLPAEKEVALADPASQRLAESLVAALTSRTSKLADVESNAQEAFEELTSTRIWDAKVALQLLRESLLEESPFGTVKLVDSGIEESIEVLDQEMEKVRVRLDAVDAESVKAGGRQSKRDEFVQRWSQE